MRRAHTNTRVAAATIAAAAGLAAPALAAPEAGEVRSPARVGAVAGWVSHAKLREPGPYVPIVGAADYGSAENAFGAARSGHVHAGQDMFAPAGTTLVAVTESTVIETGSDGGQGNYVHLYDDERELTYVYMHMVEPTTLEQGEQVAAGERVGGVGCTGSCWGDHLHFEVREGRGWTGEPRDPVPLLRDWQTLKRPR